VLNSYLIELNLSKTQAGEDNTCFKAGKRFSELLKQRFRQLAPFANYYINNSLSSFYTNPKSANAIFTQYANTKYYVAFFGNDFLEDVNAQKVLELHLSTKSGEINLEGVYTAIIIDITSNHVSIYSDITGLYSPFYFQNNNTLYLTSHEALAYATGHLARELNHENAFLQSAMGWQPLGGSLLKRLNRANGFSVFKFQNGHWNTIPYAIDRFKSDGFEACVDTIEKVFTTQKKLFVELTAGVDSRSLLSAAVGANVHFAISTGKNDGGSPNRDVEISDLIANSLGREHIVFQLKKLDYNELLSTAEMAFLCSNGKGRISNCFYDPGTISQLDLTANATLVGGEAGGIFKGKYFPNTTNFKWVSNGYSLTHNLLLNEIKESSQFVSSQLLESVNHSLLEQANKLNAFGDNYADSLTLFFALKGSKLNFAQVEFNWIKKYAPFISKSLISYALSLEPEKRHRHVFHEKILDLNLKRLGKIPFNNGFYLKQGKMTKGNILDKLNSRKYLIKTQNKKSAKLNILNQHLQNGLRELLINHFEIIEPFLKEGALNDIFIQQESSSRILKQLDHLLAIVFFYKNLKELDNIKD
jgi:hypothetical protein